MPYYFEFNFENRILRCRFEGLLTDEILREYYRIAPKYVEMHAPCSGIFDMLSVNSFEVTPPLQGQHTRPNLHVVRSLKEVWVILGMQVEPAFEPIALE
jgi:hypothetical protein